MSEQMVEKYWSRFADQYDQNQEYVVGKAFLDEIAAELNQLPDLGEVLELGCGTGKFTTAVAHKATSLIATDLSDELLEKTKKRLMGNPKISLQKENCMQLSFKPDRFDSVFAANLIHVVENPGRIINESRRILKTGGKLIIVTYTSYGMKFLEKIKLGLRFLKCWGKPPRHTHNFSPENLTALIKDAGFRIEESKLIGEKTKAIFVIGVKC